LLTITGGTQSLSYSSTYTGATDIQGGTLVLVSGASLKSAVTVASGATLNIATGLSATGSATIVSLSGAGTVNLGTNTQVTNTLILSNANNSIFSGVISGTGGLWIGAGTEKLTGNNTYTGTTTVSTGTLVLTGSLAATSKLTVNGTFDAPNAAGTTLTFAR